MIRKLSDLIGKGSLRRSRVSLVAADPDALVLSVTERQESGRIVTRMARVSGSWRVGPANSLEFALSKDEAKKGIVSFGAGWQVNKKNEIELSFGRDRAVLKGVWDVADGKNLVYQVRSGPGRELAFRGALQSPSILAKKGEIRFQLGAGTEKKARSRVIRLFGKWILSRDLNLSFDIEYGDGRRRAILFGGECRMSVDRTIRVELVARKDRLLGAELVLTQETGDGSLFARLSRTLEETRAEAGLTLNW